MVNLSLYLILLLLITGCQSFDDESNYNTNSKSENEIKLPYEVQKLRDEFLSVYVPTLVSNDWLNTTNMQRYCKENCLENPFTLNEKTQNISIKNNKARLCFNAFVESWSSLLESRYNLDVSFYIKKEKLIKFKNKKDFIKFENEIFSKWLKKLDERIIKVSVDLHNKNVSALIEYYESSRKRIYENYSNSIDSANMQRGANQISNALAQGYGGTPAYNYERQYYSDINNAEYERDFALESLNVKMQEFYSSDPYSAEKYSRVVEQVRQVVYLKPTAEELD